MKTALVLLITLIVLLAAASAAPAVSSEGSTIIAGWTWDED